MSPLGNTELMNVFSSSPMVLYRFLLHRASQAPRTVLFEDQVLSISAFGELNETGQWSKAAEMLSTIELNFPTSMLNDLYELFKCVHVAHLYLKDNDAVNAEAFINNASLLVGKCPHHVLSLQYEVCFARILDLKGMFLTAAFKYYKISKIELRQIGDDEWIDEEPLAAAVKCTLLAPDGPRRSMLLETLYKDEWCSTLKIYPILHKVHLKQKMSKEEVSWFAKELKPHQLVSVSGFMERIQIGMPNWINKKRLLFLIVVLMTFSFADLVKMGIQENVGIYGNKPKAATKPKFKYEPPQYYTLSVTWPRSFCLDNNHRDTIAHVPRDRFTLHGFWPPEHDALRRRPFSSQLVLNDRFLFTRAQTNWLSLNPHQTNMEFWAHEWALHGDRGYLDQMEYMKMALDVFDHVRHGLEDIASTTLDTEVWDSQFRAMTVAVDPYHLVSDIRFATGVKPRLVCRRSNNPRRCLLTEIRFNVTVSFASQRPSFQFKEDMEHQFYYTEGESVVVFIKTLRD